MQFTLIALVSFFAVAFAAPTPVANPERIDDVTLRARQDSTLPTTAPSTESAAMTDASGNVVSFDSTAVYLPAAAAGQ